jgi:7-cyano-7-deazaguanine synthase
VSASSEVFGGVLKMGLPSQSGASMGAMGCDNLCYVRETIPRWRGSGMAQDRVAVALISGGIDSYVAAAVAKYDYSLHGLFINYGQRNRQSEAASAEDVADHLGIPLRTIVLEIPRPVPGPNDPPIPLRNLFFFTAALAEVIVLGGFTCVFGGTSTDYDGFRDCRPKFLEQFEKTASLAHGSDLSIFAPLVGKTKAEVVALGGEEQLRFDLTTSCYHLEPGGTECGKCPACVEKKKAGL